MLAQPDMKKPINPEAAEMIMRSPHSYRQMVLDCVAASQRVEGSFRGMDPAKYSKTSLTHCLIQVKCMKQRHFCNFVKKLPRFHFSLLDTTYYLNQMCVLYYILCCCL